MTIYQDNKNRHGSYFLFIGVQIGIQKNLLIYALIAGGTRDYLVIPRYKVFQKSMGKGSGLLLGPSYPICEFSAGMFQKSSSTKFGEVGIHFSMNVHFSRSSSLRHAWISSSLSYFCLAYQHTRCLKRMRCNERRRYNS